MGLYLVSRTDGTGYDEYSSAVIAAKTESDAMAYAMGGTEETYGDDHYWDARFEGFRRDGSNLTIRQIAARTSEPSGTVLASFNAG